MEALDLYKLGIKPGLELLPSKMDGRDAVRMMYAIAWQESRVRHRRQLPNGPANGFWQFERGGGVLGVLRHHATKEHAERACKYLNVNPTSRDVHSAIQYNDVLASVFARLLLWSDPKAIPRSMDKCWDYYLGIWRPGKPHEKSWMDAWHYGIDSLDEVTLAGLRN